MTTKDKYKKVAYYPGCALEGTGHSYNRSTKAVGQGTRPRPRRGQELELLRGDGSQEHRPEIADLPVIACDVRRGQ